MRPLLLSTLPGIEEATVIEVKRIHPLTATEKIGEGKILVENFPLEKVGSLRTILCASSVLGIRSLEVLSPRTIRKAIREILRENSGFEFLEVSLKGLVTDRGFSEKYLEVIAA
ncbi:MAG TPA: hypothetical protein ENF55_06195, partial [Thermoprotei archaeon]|nr:hypothetical protein [Thermoprotei archaeon]